MAQTETATDPSPADVPIDWTNPLNWSGLDKLDLTALLALLIEAEGKLDVKILELHTKSMELKALDEEFDAQHRGEYWDPDTDPLLAKCRAASHKQHRLHVEIEKDNSALLPIRFAIVTKKSELVVATTW